MIDNGSTEQIGTVTIDPRAEPTTNTPPSVSGQQEDAFYAATKLKYDLEVNKQHLGWLGQFFGSLHVAPVYIAGVVAVVSTILLAVTFFLSTHDVSEGRKILVGLISTSLAFLFGASTKK